LNPIAGVRHMFMPKVLHHGKPKAEREPRRKAVKVYRVIR
jgi:hypothetical protein